MYEQDCSGINQTDIPPGGGSGKSVRALDDGAVEASITEE